MQPMVRASMWVLIGCLLLVGRRPGGLAGQINTPPSSQAVLTLIVRGVIDPVVAQYVTGRLDLAADTQARLAVIFLDTPGGLDTARREIVQVRLNTDIPVVVYVAPLGARAASASVFMTMTTHVAAMTPGTNIGAAHPVAMGDQVELPTSLEDKLTNDIDGKTMSLQYLEMLKTLGLGPATK